jgi:hypothetical protein
VFSLKLLLSNAKLLIMAENEPKQSCLGKRYRDC